jgi:hypothetical protein
MVLNRLAAEESMASRLTFLVTDQGVSPHSVAEVQVDGRWVLSDVFRGYIPRTSTGALATREEVMSSPDPVLLVGQDVSWYQHARVFLTVPSDPLSAVLGKLPDGLVNTLQDLYLKLPPESTHLAWTHQAVSPYSSPDGRLYFQARNHQLFGRQRPARDEFTELVQKYPSSQFADDAKYNLALMHPTADDEVVGSLQSLSSDSSVPLSDDARYLEARYYEKMGPQGCQSASDLYNELIRGLSADAAAATFRLGHLTCPAINAPDSTS